MSLTTLDFDSSTLTCVLRQSTYPDVRRLRVQVSEDTVILSGIVPSFFLKQIAQESLRSCLGGRRLINKVVVVPAK
jgi:hypothetical protein